VPVELCPLFCPVQSKMMLGSKVMSVSEVSPVLPFSGNPTHMLSLGSNPSSGSDLLCATFPPNVVDLVSSPLVEIKTTKQKLTSSVLQPCLQAGFTVFVTETL